MAIIKCKMCGGDVEIAPDKTFGTCEYCGSTMTFPKVDDDQRAAAFNRGNHFRRIGEFDKALQVYERIVREDDNDAEAHWCCALCRFGIEYVEDPASLEYIPTCHRASFDNFLEDVDYLAAVEHSEGITRKQYQRDGLKIAEVQRGILATSQNEEPYDVFICYKETDENGDRTRDSAMAQDIYYQLTEQGRRVFFARITLEDKVGAEYEPYIFAALHSAKVMVVVGTSAENLNAVWVKNEWSRFLAMMKHDRNKLLLPCYRDMDPYDLPDQLGVLQSYDMSKIGFIQDLIRGVSKVLDASEKTEVIPDVPQQTQGAGSVGPLLIRAKLFLEDGDWHSANEYCERILDITPENGEAYLYKLMAEKRCHKREELPKCAEPFENESAYQKVIRFGSADLRAEIKGYNDSILKRNEETRLNNLYNKAQEVLKRAKTDSDYKNAAENFKPILEYKDSEQQYKRCLEVSEVLRKDAILDHAKQEADRDTIEGREFAIALLKEIPGWKNADQITDTCRMRISEIQAEEARKAESIRQQREAKEKAEKKKKRCIRIVSGVVVLALVGSAGLYALNLECQYKDAMKLLNMGHYDDAITIFDNLNNYKDSRTRLINARLSKQNGEKEGQYNAAAVMESEGKLPKAALYYGKAGAIYDAYTKSRTLWNQSRELITIDLGNSLDFNMIAIKDDDSILAIEGNHYKQMDNSSWKHVTSVVAGLNHFVGLKATGTVLTQGDNTFGQCDTQEWCNVVEVAAGSNHTVGLKRNGAVYACGSNQFGECDVTGWKDIVAIAAGDHHTIGLRSDGTLVSAGVNISGQCDVKDWKDIVQIYAGAASTAAIDCNGKIYYAGPRNDDQNKITKQDNIRSIALAPHHVVTLRNDGTVVCFGDNTDDKCETSEWKDIVAIAAGPNHTVGLKADGTLMAAGDVGKVPVKLNGLAGIKLP